MIHGLTFKEYVEEEKTKLSEMNKAEKIDYFKEYYLKLCIFAVVVLILFSPIGLMIMYIAEQTASPNNENTFRNK